MEVSDSERERELLPLLIVVQCASFSRHRYAIFHPRGQTVEVSTAIFFAVGEAYQKGRRGHRRCAAVDRGRRIVLPCQPRVKHLPAGGRPGGRAAFPCGKNCPDTVRNRGFGAVLVASAASVPMTKLPSLPASLQVPSRVDGPTRGERERGLETGAEAEEPPRVRTHLGRERERPPPPPFPSIASIRDPTFSTFRLSTTSPPLTQNTSLHLPLCVSAVVHSRWRVWRGIDVRLIDRLARFSRRMHPRSEVRSHPSQRRPSPRKVNISF